MLLSLVVSDKVVEIMFGNVKTQSEIVHCVSTSTWQFWHLPYENE